MEREHQLIDLMFEAVMYVKNNKSMHCTNDKRVKSWLREQLHSFGYITKEVGCNPAKIQAIIKR